MGTRAIRSTCAAAGLGVATLALAGSRISGAGGRFGAWEASLCAIALLLVAGCFLPIPWALRLLSAAFSTALSLAGAELVLRTFAAPRFVPPFEADARLLYRLAPGATREVKRSEEDGGERIRYSINRSGYRGEELEPPGAAPRLVVYGDSFIQAEFSALDQTFPVRLAHHLREVAGRRFEVVNAGVAGYGPDQVLRRMQRELRELAPALAIVAIYAGNDFGDPVRNKLYRIGAHGELVENPARPSSEIAWSLGAARSEPVLRRAAREALRRLRGDANPGRELERASRSERAEAMLAQGLAEYRNFVTERDDGVRELMADLYSADVALEPESESARFKRALAELLIAEIRKTAARAQVPLVLLLIPSPIDVVGTHASAQIDRDRHPDYSPTALTDALAEIARRRGIPYLDLFEPFQRHGAEQLYFRSFDDHWNDRGQDLAALLLARFLIESGALGGS